MFAGVVHATQRAGLSASTFAIASIGTMRTIPGLEPRHQGLTPDQDMDPEKPWAQFPLPTRATLTPFALISIGWAEVPELFAQKVHLPLVFRE